MTIENIIKETKDSERIYEKKIETLRNPLSLKSKVKKKKLTV